MSKFILEQSSTETLSSHGGLILVGEYLNTYSGLENSLSEIPLHHGVSHMDMLRTGIGLLCLGKSDFEAVADRREDEFFKLSLGISRVLSESRLRQRYDEYSQILTEKIFNANTEMLKNLKVPVTPLHTGHVAVDADATPYDNSRTKKEHVGRTYKGFDGYNPMKVYLGEEGWCITAELRPGTWNGQNEFLYIMEQAHDSARTLTALPLLWRLDSQHDALDNRIWLYNEEDDFIIRWNPRGEAKKNWVAYTEGLGHWCEWSEPREGKKVGIFTMYVDKEHKGVTYTFRRVMRVTIRHINKKGQRRLIPETEIEG